MIETCRRTVRWIRAIWGNKKYGEFILGGQRRELMAWQRESKELVRNHVSVALSAI